MAENIDMKKITVRTFGWVQDPNDFGKLKNVVRVFDNNSDYHKELKTKIIPNEVKDIKTREILINEMNKRPLKIAFKLLKGTGPKKGVPRAQASCDGIIQAAIPGQGIGRNYIGDWPAENYVRWAYALDFIKYNYIDDTFEITESGMKFIKSEDGTRKANKKNSEYILSEEERGILVEGIMKYTPAVRILKLLENGEHLTKYELGSKIGFSGEGGFTSLPQEVLLESIVMMEDKSKKREIKTDSEGSSDKYARTIAGWLTKLGLVNQVSKSFNISIGNEIFNEELSQAYKITTEGIKEIKRAKGSSKIKRTTKKIVWEMLYSAKDSDREYIRTRRSYVLKLLMSKSKEITIDVILNELEALGFKDSAKTIENDIEGLISIGLNVNSTRKGYKLLDEVDEFSIPNFLIGELKKSETEELKQKLREELKYVSPEYLVLIDLALDSKQNKIFEMKTMELLVNECGFKGLHLGGSNKPDGIAYTTSCSSSNYGIIIDTKAYSKGFSIPIAEADKMKRYVEQNKLRDEKMNPNKWWEIFPEKIDKFYYMFVSGKFVGEFEDKLKDIAYVTKVKGAVLSVINLLKLADMIKSRRLTFEQFEKNYLSGNKEIIL